MSEPTLRHLSRPIADWTNETVGERIEACARMLYFHGLLTEAEKARVAKRLHKRRLRELREGIVSSALAKGGARS